MTNEEKFIEALMRDVDWKKIPPSPDEDYVSDLPYATHEGVFKIGEFEFKVYQLNNGQRLIDSEDMHRFWSTQ